MTTVSAVTGFHNSLMLGYPQTSRFPPNLVNYVRFVKLIETTICIIFNKILISKAYLGCYVRQVKPNNNNNNAAGKTWNGI